MNTMAEAPKAEESKQEIGDKIDIRKQNEVVLHPKLAKNEFPKEELDHETNRSLMAKFLTEEMFNKYKDVKTKAAKFTIARAINTGVKNPDSFMGCHAGDIESWTTFADLFDPCISEYHGGYKPTDKHPSDAMDAEKLKGTLSLTENCF